MDNFNGNGHVVLGCQFGDEGKGLVTDFVCSRSDKPIVIRYSGGQQAGHTVLHDGVRHVFSNFGSGTLRGVPTYWAPSATFDPVGMMREMKILLEKGITPKLYVDERCAMTTPYDKMHNRLAALKNKHGSCGVGVGATVDREEANVRLAAGDLRSQFVFEQKLQGVFNYYSGIHGGGMKVKRLGTEHTVVSPNPYGGRVNLTEFYDALREMLESPHVEIVSGIPDRAGYASRVFESSQGLMLDPDIGFFPHVTRIPVGTRGMLGMHRDPTVFAVTRAYTTRHGNGPMPNDGMPNNIAENPDETNVYNGWQGEFRRGVLDLDVVKYAIGRDEYLRSTVKRVLVITCMDHVQSDRRFTYNGQTIGCLTDEEFISAIAQVLDFKVVYASYGPSATDIRSFKPGGSWDSFNASETKQ